MTKELEIFRLFERCFGFDPRFEEFEEIRYDGLFNEKYTVSVIFKFFEDECHYENTGEEMQYLTNHPAFFWFCIDKQGDFMSVHYIYKLHETQVKEWEQYVKESNHDKNH